MNVKGIDLCMHDEERLLIEKYLKTKKNINNISMLEWGSGGSTLYFSDMVDEYFSIEHDKTWYEKIKNLINDNVTYEFVPLHSNKFDKDLDSAADGIWNNWDNLKRKKDGIVYRGLRGPTKDWHELTDYIKKPLEFNNKNFNFVLVDGRARPMCAYLASHIISKDGYLFVHDFGVRPYYFNITKYFKPIDRSDSLFVFKLREKFITNEEILNKYNEKMESFAQYKQGLSAEFICKYVEDAYKDMEKDLEECV